MIRGFGTTANVPTADVLVYDLATRSWGEAAPLPAPRGGHAAVVLDGRIHVVGGGNEARRSRSTPSTTRQGTAGPRLSRCRARRKPGRGRARRGALGDRRAERPEDYGDVHVYDPAADAWSPGPPIPPRGTHGAAAHGGAIYVFGGESQARGTVLAGVLRLDREQEAWVQVRPGLPTARAYARAVPFANGILVVGGSTEAGASHASSGSAIVEQFSPAR